MDPVVVEALDVLRRAPATESSSAEAALVRRAVLEGVALESVIEAAASGGKASDDARRLISLLTSLLDDIDGLPMQVKTEVVGRLQSLDLGPDPRDLRKRQLELLEIPDPWGDVAIQLNERLDHEDPLAADAA